MVGAQVLELRCGGCTGPGAVVCAQVLELRCGGCPGPGAEVWWVPRSWS